MKEKLYNILEKFVVNNNIKINPEDFKLQLISNPSYPSVKSISDTLDYFGIDNIVANVPKDALEQLPHCFLAVIETASSKTIAQVLRKNDRIKILKDDGSNENLSIKNFKESWNGTVIAVEKTTDEKKGSISFLKNPLIPLSIILTVAFGFKVFDLETQAILYTLFSIAGCCISYFIVRESLGLQNEVTSKICNSSANNTSCNEVINSKTIKLFQLISLSDASITIFGSIVLVITFFGYNSSFFLGLSLLSIPIILYSIYSQAFEIKKWCPLCLGIATVLIGQVVITVLYSVAFEFNLVYFIKSITLVIVVYLAWVYIKSLLIKSIKQEQTQTEFLKFKRNEGLFDTLLTKEKLKSKEKLSAEFSITFGNPQAPLVIHSVTNPLCGFCTKSFEAYDSLLKIHGDKFKLNIIFNVPSDLLENPTSQISQQIINLYADNPNQAYTSLKDWFTDRDIDLWQEKYGIPSENSSLHTLEMHNTWCNLNEINFTPATIIGDYYFPKEYDIKDLSLFIDRLIEQKKNKKKEPSIHQSQ